MIKFICCVFIISSLAISGENFWSSNGPCGGMVRWLSIDPSLPSTIYAAVNRTVYKTTNGGNTWFFTGWGISTRGMAWQVIIDRADPSIIFVATGDSLYKSTNSGANWRAANSGITTRSTRCITIDPVNHSILYCGTNGYGLFKSINGGENWTKSDSGITSSYIYSVAIHPVSTNIVFASTADGVFKSTDHGANWSPAGSNGPCYSLRIDPKAPSIIYGAYPGVKKSTDEGDNWFDSGLPGLDVVSITIDPVASSILYAGTWNEGGLHKSTDAGATWNQIGTAVPNPHLNFIAIDPNSSAVVYLGTLGNGVYKSVNGGNSFSFLSQGLVKDDARSIAVHPMDTTIAYATTQWGAFKSTDGGESWSNSIFRHGTMGMGGIWIDPFTPQHVYLAYGVQVATNSAVWKSTNGGNSWSGSSNGIMNGGGVSCFAAIPSARNCFYANAGKLQFPGDTMMLYKTTNGGNSWRATGFVRNIVAFASHPTNPNITYVAARNRIAALTGGVYKTTDGGNSWFEVRNGIPNNLLLSLVMDPNDPEVLYVGMEGWRDDEIYKTTDGGNSWFPSSNGLPSDGDIKCLAIDPLLSQNLYAGLRWEKGVYRSTNAGADWASMNDSLPPLWYLDIDAITVAPLAPAIIFCGLTGRAEQGGGVWKYTVGPVSITENEHNKKSKGILSISPNPCRVKTVIKFSTGQRARSLELTIYDATGQLVKSFPLAVRYSLLSTSITWDGSDDNGCSLPAGVYFCRLAIDDFIMTEKIIRLH